jgi:hypothetical protein
LGSRVPSVRAIAHIADGNLARDVLLKQGLPFHSALPSYEDDAMLALLGLTLALVLLFAFIYTELRSAWYEITLSSGIEVLVDAEMYEEIVRRYQMSDEPDSWKRWDEAVLSDLRTERPTEWEYLALIHQQEKLREQSARRSQHEVVHT